MLGAGWTDDAIRALICLYMLKTACVRRHHGINSLYTSTGVRELLDRSSEERESARGEPYLVHAGLTTLHCK